MAEEFTFGTLLALCRSLRSISMRGDDLPSPLGETDNKILATTANLLLDRIVLQHLSPGEAEPETTAEHLLKMVRACDALVTKGDGHPSPVSDPVTSTIFAARQVLLGRLRHHPNGNLIASMHVETQAAAVAAGRAVEARRNAVQAASAQASEVVAEPISPQLAAAIEAASPLPTITVAAQPPAVSAAPDGGAFVFGQPASEAPLDPPQPGPAAPPEPGLTAAQ